jgi:hypothetical protein
MPACTAAAGSKEASLSDALTAELPILLFANKSDLDPGADEVSVLEELAGVRFPRVRGLGNGGPRPSASRPLC